MKMAKIMIDAGHGGHDPGAIGSRSKEKDNVLKVSKKLKTLLEKHGHTVELTRYTDIFLNLSERARMANKWGADYFISLHNNSAVNRNATGFETFIYNGKVSEKTVNFQKFVHDEIAKHIGIRDRGKKRANFAVLRETKMPAVLIEYAFISNIEDETILIEKADELAKWTCNGIIKAIGGKAKKEEKTEQAQTHSKENKQKTAEKRQMPKVSIKVDGKWGKETTRALQTYFGTTVDGIISDQLRNHVTTALYGKTVEFGNGRKGSLVIRALQRHLGGLVVDGLLGPKTIFRLQQYLGTPLDGKLSRPSKVVEEMQRRLNDGTF